MRSQWRAERRERRLDLAANSSQLLNGGAITRVDSSAATRLLLRRGVERVAQRSSGARSRPCARNAASTSGWRSRVKFRKSGEPDRQRGRSRGARDRRISDRIRPLESSDGISIHGARPASRRPSASRCVTFRRSAPAACSTGIRAFSVPAARFRNTGSLFDASPTPTRRDRQRLQHLSLRDRRQFRQHGHGARRCQELASVHGVLPLNRD